MNKIIKRILQFILIVATLDLFAFSVAYVMRGYNKLGILTPVIQEFYNFPLLAINVYHEFTKPTTTIKVSPNFKPINQLNYDVYAINSSYEDSHWVIKLKNLRNDSILYKWHLYEKDCNMSDNRIFSHMAQDGILLLKDSSIILNNTYTKNLFRLDKKSNVIWHNTKFNFHHSKNLDPDGNIWTCTHKIYNFSEKRDIEYWDDCITKIDVNDGHCLFNKSIREILIDNNLEYLVYGINNTSEWADVETNIIESFHLNDIEPTLKDGTFWKKGDLFISLRSRSMIFLYRPSTNKVLRTIYGPFISQHDIDIQSDSTITLFNNNTCHIIDKSILQANKDIFFSPDTTFNSISNVVCYNLKDSTFTNIYQNQFISNKIYTSTEGLHKILSNGDMFVESQNEGKVYIFNKDKVLVKEYYNPVKNGMVEPSHWVKIYENLNFLKE